MTDRHSTLCAIAGDVSRETFEALGAFEHRFRVWNARINLVSQSTLDDFWSRHILDSAQLFALAPKATTWMDIGSGGGFPGLVLAFLLRDRPAGSIALVESNRKKAAFLQAMAGEFRLPARIHAVRIEDVSLNSVEPEVVTARALANLSLLLELTAPWLETGARGLFHKGRDYRAEIEESSHKWRYDLIQHASVTDPQSVVLEISRLESR